MLTANLFLDLQVINKQSADKTQKLFYSIEHKIPVITSSLYQKSVHGEDTQPEQAINISSVNFK